MDAWINAINDDIENVAAAPAPSAAVAVPAAKTAEVEVKASGDWKQAHHASGEGAALVIDVGSAMIKAGIAGEKRPKLHASSVVARYGNMQHVHCHMHYWCNLTSADDGGQTSTYVGEFDIERVPKKRNRIDMSSLSFSFPRKNGLFLTCMRMHVLTAQGRLKTGKTKRKFIATFSMRARQSRAARY
jgi:hypothetical protein